MLGAGASIAFGLIPLFSLPMMHAGILTPSILAYRFIFASIGLFILLKIRRVPMGVSLQQAFTLIGLGLIYVCSAMGLQLGYRYMESGVATVIHFTFPIWVILLLLLFYKQRPAPITLVAVSLAFGGVAALAGIFGVSQPMSLAGFLIVAFSGLAYGSYIVIVNKSCVSEMNPGKLSFYALAVCGLSFVAISLASGGLQPLTTPRLWFMALSLAFLSTLLPNIALVKSVKLTGSTLASILGALEPLTAIIVGIVVFNEEMTLMRAVGMLLIIVAVLLIALSGKIAYRWRVYRLRHRRR